jgi:hypothetical protein
LQINFPGGHPGGGSERPANAGLERGGYLPHKNIFFFPFPALHQPAVATYIFKTRHDHASFPEERAAMKVIHLFSSLIFFIVIAISPVRAGEDEFVTLSDGRTLVLHDNYTWDIKGGGAAGLAGDITVNVYGDKNIVLHENKTWDFADKDGNPAPRKASKLTSVSATATASRESQIEARDAAREAAIKKVADQLRPSIDDGSMSVEALLKCVGRVANPVTVKQGRLKKKQWTVTLKITLSKGEIEGITDCTKTPEGQ